MRAKAELNLFRRRLERSEVAERHGRQRIGEPGEVGRDLREARPAFAPPVTYPASVTVGPVRIEEA